MAVKRGEHFNDFKDIYGCEFQLYYSDTVIPCEFLLRILDLDRNLRNFVYPAQGTCDVAVSRSAVVSVQLNG
jgi:hypothetical protein